MNENPEMENELENQIQVRTVKGGIGRSMKGKASIFSPDHKTTHGHLMGKRGGPWLECLQHHQTYVWLFLEKWIQKCVCSRATKWVSSLSKPKPLEDRT